MLSRGLLDAFAAYSTLHHAVGAANALVGEKLTFLLWVRMSDFIRILRDSLRLFCSGILCEMLAFALKDCTVNRITIWQSHDE